MKVSGQIHDPATLLPWKEPWYPLHRSLGGPQSRSAQFHFNLLTVGSTAKAK